MSAVVWLSGETIEIYLPLRVVSAANIREYWRARAGRVKRERRAVAAAWPRGLPKPPRPLPLVVTLVRIAPRSLDGDNLCGGFKAVRDEVALRMGLDDGDKRIEWRYEQERPMAGEGYGCLIRIEGT